MWNPFRKKGMESPTKKDSAIPKQSNRVDELANALQKDGRINELEEELEKLEQHSLTASEQESWWHLYGIVALQEKRDEEALERFKQAYEKFPKSAQIRFSLGQQYIRTGSIEEGFTLFRTCMFPEVPREYALAQARYAYLCGRYRDGMDFIRPFYTAYKQVKILDDHFLYVRGLPFFGSWWSYLAAFSILTGDVAELEAVTKFVTKKCYDYDFENMHAELIAYRDDRPEVLLGFLEERLARISNSQFPSGYTSMSIAVIKSRAAKSLEDATKILSDVPLSEKDFSWLQDIRTLALAEAANRFCEVALEERLIESFISQRLMLFEPDIALDFNLLRYQERLKERASLR